MFITSRRKHFSAHLQLFIDFLQGQLHSRLACLALLVHRGLVNRYLALLVNGNLSRGEHLSLWLSVGHSLTNLLSRVVLARSVLSKVLDCLWHHST